jgi:hypothetical protein
MQPMSPAFGAAESALDPTKLPGTPADADTSAVELGLQFTSSVNGTVDEIKFFKGSDQNVGPHTGSLWSASGELLSRTTFTAETPTGWQTAKLPAAVPIVAGQGYVVSYHAPAGRYSADNAFFESPTQRGRLTLPAAAGVYTYGDSAFPSSSYGNSNYYVDVTFMPDSATQPASPIPAPSATPSANTLRDIDGGLDYYSKFTNPLPSTDSFFPLGVWYESIRSEDDVARDKEAGLNLYVELTGDSDTSLLGPEGPYAITSGNMSGISGQITTDEADMWGGPGDAAWTGKYPGEGDICSPSGEQCGYTIMDSLRANIPDGMMAYTNYGKGVTFWESDAEAARFVNDYQDVVSADNYWFTDPNICGAYEGGQFYGGRALSEADCRLAANYGSTIDRLRSLVKPEGSKPVWAFVEVGHPSDVDSTPTATGPQIRAAVWSSIIHGARGVVYFNHNFGGDCISQHVLRDSCGQEVRPDVTAVNKQVTSLAPVLNAPFLDGATTASGAVDHMAKVSDGQVYVFAASAQAASQTVEITNSCISSDTVTVVGENRTLKASGGQFTDQFADGNAVHIYTAPAKADCVN